MKRNRGRNRRSGGQNPNRHYESNGPDVKIRGSAQQICEKYQQYARDAQSAGDRVAAENYLQHAEHYFRIVAAMQPKDRPQQQDGARGEDGENADSDSDDETVDADAESNADEARDSGEEKPRRGRRPRKPRDDNQTESNSDDRAQGDDPLKVVADDAEADAPQDIGKSSEETEEPPKPKRRRAPRKKPETVAEDEDASGVMAIVSRGAPKPEDDTSKKAEETPAE